MSEDLSNIKTKILTLTLQNLGIETENRMIDIEKQCYVNTGMVKCANEVFSAIEKTKDHIEKSENPKIEDFVAFLKMQIMLVRDNAHAKRNECSGKIFAYQDIIDVISEKIKEAEQKSSSSNVGTRPEEREDVGKRRKNK